MHPPQCRFPGLPVNYLEHEFPEQFQGPHYLGTSIPESWEPIVAQVLQCTSDILNDEELKHFFWVQIKEKCGGLRMYWRVRLAPIEQPAQGNVPARVMDVPFSISAIDPELDAETQRQLQQAAIARQRWMAIFSSKVAPLVQKAESLASCTPIVWEAEGGASDEKQPVRNVQSEDGIRLGGNHLRTALIHIQTEFHRSVDS